MIDRYTKAVLTVIAAALCGIVVQNSVGDARAVGDGCGGRFDPCNVTLERTIDVRVDGAVEVYGSVTTN